MRSALTFIDLFAGLGGFHLALTDLGHKCVFASEIDTELSKLYKNNFGISPAGDIRTDWEKTPPHDILCAGFPCQPFSKAGAQKGFTCPDSGDLFQYVIKIIDLRNPQFILLENVPNIVKHENGATWNRIKTCLEDRGYSVECKNLSPDMFGIPQTRNRAIIVASKFGLSNFSWPERTHASKDLSISTILSHNPTNAKKLSAQYKSYLNTWQHFLDLIPAEDALPSFPIWSMEFGATYPLGPTTPAQRTIESLSRYKGSFGIDLSGMTKEQQILSLPPYARGLTGSFPSWKKNYILSNRSFFKQHKTALTEWVNATLQFPPSFQKFEWNWKGGPRDINRTIVQFRASGIRVKRPTVAPSLVALTTSQVPVVPWEERYMTPLECARLQSMNQLKNLPASDAKSYKALGNAVNVTVVKTVARNLLQESQRCRPDVGAEKNLHPYLLCRPSAQQISQVAE